MCINLCESAEVQNRDAQLEAPSTHLVRLQGDRHQPRSRCYMILLVSLPTLLLLEGVGQQQLLAKCSSDVLYLLLHICKQRGAVLQGTLGLRGRSVLVTMLPPLTLLSVAASLLLLLLLFARGGGSRGP